MAEPENPCNDAFILETDREDSPGKNSSIAYFVLTDSGEQAA